MSEQQPDVWEFPCLIALKVIGDEREDFELDVVTAVQSVIPGDYRTKSMPSTNGRFVSITVPVHVHTREQVQALFAAARAVAGVRIVL